MNALLARLLAPWNLLVKGLEALQPAAQLAARVYVGHAFFASGLKWLESLLFSSAPAAAKGTAGMGLPMVNALNGLGLPMVQQLNSGFGYASVSTNVPNFFSGYGPAIARSRTSFIPDSPPMGSASP